MAGSNNTQVCRSCGTQFTQRPGRGRPRVCCPACTPSKYLLKEAGQRRGLVDLGVCVSGGLKACVVCSKAYWAMHGGQVMCSPECNAKRAVVHSRKTQTKRRKHPKGERRCANPKCGARFTTTYGDMRVRYCSLECRRKHAWTINSGSSRNRARQRGAKYQQIDPIAVFRRDGWRCQLCGLKLKAKDRGSVKPQAPELDHIIPLARGGHHLWSNVQCACRACNAAKGAKPLGQLNMPMAA